MPHTVSVVRTFLEMRSPQELRVRGDLPPDGTRIERLASSPSEYRALYQGVGRAYHWTDRDVWSDATLTEYLRQPNVAVWVLHLDGESAGYVELVAHEDSSVEIAYFGLLPAFVGRGLGAHLLTFAVQEAWRMGATRVWLHTCTLDSPVALPNYLARGFRPFREERYDKQLPATA